MKIAQSINISLQVPVAYYCNAQWSKKTEFVLLYHCWNTYHLNQKTQERKDHQLLLPERLSTFFGSELYDPILYSLYDTLQICLYDPVY